MGKTYSDADDYSACAAMTQCAAGFGATVAGTATSDTQCQACVAAADDPDRIGSYSTSIGYVDELDIYIIFSVAKYLHREMKSYTLRPDTFTLKFNFTLAGTVRACLTARAPSGRAVPGRRRSRQRSLWGTGTGCSKQACMALIGIGIFARRRHLATQLTVKCKTSQSNARRRHIIHSQMPTATRREVTAR